MMRHEHRAISMAEVQERYNVVEQFSVLVLSAMVGIIFTSVASYGIRPVFLCWQNEDQNAVQNMVITDCQFVCSNITITPRFLARIGDPKP